VDPTRLLLETAQRLFAEGSEHRVQEELENGVFQTALWSSIEDNGLPLALVSEERGGIALPLASAAAILRVAGAFALPLPLAETMIGARLLDEAGIDVPSGPLALIADPDLAVDKKRDGALLSGRARRVPWLPHAEHAVVVDDGSITLLNLAELPEDSISTLRNAAGEPLGNLELDSFKVAIEAHRSAPDCSVSDTIALGAITRVALTAGACDRVLDLCIEHANGRVQFGRPIARFQAVQQNIAIIASEVAAVSVSSTAAARAWDQYRDELVVAAAKTRSSYAADRVARLAHQVHAAIGFTREHSLHRFTRRLWAWRDDYSSEQTWALELGRAALHAGGIGFWPRLTENG
jgi:acyl-CoA dehydrogenase